MVERNEYLEERLENILNETDLERNAMIETIAMLEEKVGFCLHGHSIHTRCEKEWPLLHVYMAC